jgi:replication factor C subunit 2/4
VVRDKVKKFAKIAVSRSTNPDYPCPSYKIIILDEADSLTNDAQSALRRIIESSSKVTRFCLICNYISKIIDPLASRCTKFMFNPIGLEAHLARLQYICEQESINATNEAFE